MEWMFGTLDNWVVRSCGMWCCIIASVCPEIAVPHRWVPNPSGCRHYRNTHTRTHPQSPENLKIMPLVCAQKNRNIPGRTWVEFLLFFLRQRKGDSFLARGRSGIINSDYCITTISCSYRRLKIQGQHSISKWKMWCWMTAQELQYSDSSYYTICFDMYQITVYPARQLSCKQTQNCYKNWLPSELVQCIYELVQVEVKGHPSYFCTVVWYFFMALHKFVTCESPFTQVLTFKWWPWCILLTFNSSSTASLYDVFSVLLLFRILLSWTVVGMCTSASLKGFIWSRC